MSQSIAFGVEISPSHTSIGLVSEEGIVLSHLEFKTSNPKELSERLKKELANLLAVAKVEQAQLAAVGIVVYEQLKYSELPNTLSGSLNIPVSMTHAGNGAALAEQIYGMASDWQNFIVVSLDESVNCGIVLSGNLAMGEHQLAGGLGYMLVHESITKQVRLCDYLSSEGIKRTAWKLMADMPEDSILKNYNYRELEARHVIEAGLVKDAIALAVFAQLGNVLGAKLAEVIHHFSPEAIVLTSRWPELPNLLLASVKESMEKNTLAVFRGKALLVATGLTSKEESPILRAVAVAWNQLAMNMQG